MKLLILSAADVRRITASMPADLLLSQQARVLRTLTLSHERDDADLLQIPHRSAVTMPHHRALFMPARVTDIGTTIKVVSVPTSPGDERGLPASTLVLDEDTGAVKALVNARSLTALRTAAGSVLATTLLHPPAESHFATLVAFGAGKQIEAHVALLLQSYPTLRTVVLINRSQNERLASLLAHLQAQHPAVSITARASADPAFDVRAAVANADVICTATSSTAPLFPSAWVRAGTHLVLVGSYTPAMAEIDSALVRRARGVVVDSRSAYMAEAGELRAAGLGGADLVEVGELVREGRGPGRWEREAGRCARVREGEVTIFKSVGVGGQDVAIACAVVERAEQMGVGTTVEDFDD